MNDTLWFLSQVLRIRYILSQSQTFAVHVKHRGLAQHDKHLYVHDFALLFGFLFVQRSILEKWQNRSSFLINFVTGFKIWTEWVHYYSWYSFVDWYYDISSGTFCCFFNAGLWRKKINIVVTRMITCKLCFIWCYYCSLGFYMDMGWIQHNLKWK